MSEELEQVETMQKMLGVVATLSNEVNELRTRLDQNPNTPKPFDESHTYTAEEIRSMSLDEFKANKDALWRQATGNNPNYRM